MSLRGLFSTNQRLSLSISEQTEGGTGGLRLKLKLRRKYKGLRLGAPLAQTGQVMGTRNPRVHCTGEDARRCVLSRCQKHANEVHSLLQS